MGNTEKKLNKRLIGLVIGTAAVGGLSQTTKGKEITKQSSGFFKDKAIGFLDFVKGGLEGLKESMGKSQKDDSKKSKLPE